MTFDLLSIDVRARELLALTFVFRAYSYKIIDSHAVVVSAEAMWRAHYKSPW